MVMDKLPSGSAETTMATAAAAAAATATAAGKPENLRKLVAAVAALPRAAVLKTKVQVHQGLNCDMQRNECCDTQ